MKTIFNFLLRITNEILNILRYSELFSELKDQQMKPCA